MLRWRILLLAVLLLTLLAPFAGTCQDYLYKHYDARDGLANSSVYQMLQDKDGFIWFATPTGLSRFDGTHFKNFSTDDGLPGNVIVRMFEDSRGRIWLMPFRNAVCYYYRGKIYNQLNDPMLKQIQLKDFVRDVVENKAGELLLTDSKKIYHIDAHNQVRWIGREMSELAESVEVSVRTTGTFNVRMGNKLFVTDANSFSYLREVPRANGVVEHLILQDKITCWIDRNTLCVESSYPGISSYRHFIGPVNTMFLLSDSILCLNTAQGTCLFNLFQKKIEQKFLPKGDVSDFLIDNEGGYWFSTQNDGVFRLASPVFKSIVGKTDLGHKLGVYTFENRGTEIWAGCDMGHIMRIRSDTADVVALTVAGETLGRHLVYAIASNGDQIAAGCGNYVFVKERDGEFRSIAVAGSSKDVAWQTNDKLLVASSHGLFSMRKNGTEMRLLHAGRTTCLYHRNDSTWFGTINGLFLMTPDSIMNLGDATSSLSSPVISMRGGHDGTIWIGTGGSGLIGMQGTRIVWHFNKQNGLNSDYVRCIGIDSGIVWAGTDKELNRIPLERNPVITRYSYSDEFNSTIVNTLLIKGHTVYAGTPDGIIWFDKRERPRPSKCDLKILGVSVNDEEKALQQSYTLPYRNNRIRFDYVAISMKSAGDITYRYRLNGLDPKWKSTTQTSLELISLPPGEYTLELFAANKFNAESAHYLVKIVVANPFWKSAWFMGIVILITALIVWLISRRYNQAIVRKQEFRRHAEQQLVELEQKALRAQMNPHFIFNSLNSIQRFILDKDPELANEYLNQFGSLIRQTLENSFQSFISLGDEIKYLKTYLQLEQMRSASSFEYQIQTDRQLPLENLSIPVMVLQPFVENAVRHGLQTVKGRHALVSVLFSLTEGELVCRVADNGVGRRQASLQKESESGNYPSRGMQLTYDRIAMINSNSAQKITVEIVDKFDNNDEPTGTDVFIRFPIFAGKATTGS